jgi:hypothetical protein
MSMRPVYRLSLFYARHFTPYRAQRLHARAHGLQVTPCIIKSLSNFCPKLENTSPYILASTGCRSGTLIAQAINVSSRCLRLTEPGKGGELNQRGF